MKKKVKLKFNEMNKKQKVFFVIDWLMRGILIVLCFIIAVTMFISCAKSCNKDNETSVAYAESSIDLHNLESINFKNNIFNIPIYNFVGEGGGSVGTAWLIIYGMPLIEFTIELVENNSTGLNYELHTVYKDGTSSALSFINKKYISYNLENIINFSYLEIRMFGNQTFNINNNFYFYAGPYVPGYGQGLAAGLAQGNEQGKAEGYEQGYKEGFEVGNQQGYDKGYNQGAADTANQYGLGVFRESEVKFAYLNQPSDLTYNSFNTSLNVDFNGKVYFLDYPVLSSNYNYYYLYVVFKSPFILNSDTFYFTFPGVISDSAIPRINFFNSDDNSVQDNLDSSKFLFSVPSGASSGTYGLAIMPGNNESSYFGRPYNKMLIRVDGSGAYDFLKGLQISTVATGDSSYYVGFDKGYNQGFESGESQGFQTGYDNGFNLGSSTGYDNGYSAGYIDGEDIGYNKGHSIGFQEGFNQNESGGFVWLISSVQSFLDFKFFGDFGIGTLIYVALGATLVLYFLKVLAGG